MPPYQVTTSGRWLAVPRYLVTGGAITLALLYTMRYLSFPALPGNVPELPLGWWGWFDQGKTLMSARALASGDFAAEHHWYPLGYSALGALFANGYRAHPFYLLNLALLLATYVSFVAFARRIAIGPAWSVPVFLLTTASDRRIFDQWVIPWNTTATAALTWLLLYVVSAHMQGVRRPFVVGLLVAAIPIFRPTEALLAVPCLVAALFVDLRHQRLSLADVGRFLIGAALPVLPYAILYLRIYGPHPSEYMIQSREIGFTLYDIGWKAYVILLDPRGWFMDGEGLLRREPWIALGLAGALPAAIRRNGATLLAILLAIHGVFYLSYVDLLPTGFWRYNNVHYWTWSIPGYGILAVLLVQDLVQPVSRLRRWLAVASTIATAAILCVHLEPQPATAADRVKMLDLSGPAITFDHAYFGHWTVQDDAGDLANIRDIRGIPTATGMRVLALRRPFVGTVRWPHAESWQPEGNPLRSRVGLRLGRPCWLIGCPVRPAISQLPPAE